MNFSCMTGSAQEKEMKLSYQQKRQPNCVYCKHSLDTVVQDQDERIVWSYDAKLRQYKKSEEGTAERPYHYCLNCRDNCEASDWGYLDEKLISF